jgi:hypothetical protein
MDSVKKSRGIETPVAATSHSVLSLVRGPAEWTHVAFNTLLPGIKPT